MINKASLDIIKEFEGLKLTAYKCSAGKWTIGYGTTAGAGVGIEPKAGMTITEAQANEYLHKGITKFSLQIRDMLKVAASNNEFGAMVSLAYNIGPTAFSKSSVLRHFNTGDKEKAADAFLLWNKADGKVLNGLVRRRKAERDLFLTPDTIAHVKDSLTTQKPAHPLGPIRDAESQPVVMDDTAPPKSSVAVIVALISGAIVSILAFGQEVWDNIEEFVEGLL